MSSTNADSMRVSNSTLSDNSIFDIYADGGGGLLKVAVKANTITIGNSGSAIKFENANAGGTISNNSITGNASSTNGIVLSLTMTGAPTISGNMVTGLSNGACVSIEAGAAVLTTNDLKNSKWGVRVTGGTPQIGLAGSFGSSSDNLLRNNTTGASISCSQSGTCPSGCTTNVKIRNNQIYSNTYGIMREKSAIADVGAGSDEGLNSIYGNTAYCIQNKSSTCGSSVMAEGNWFGTAECLDLPLCTNGTVDIFPFLCTQPASRGDFSVEPVPEEAGPAVELIGVAPNPIRDVGVVRFRIGQGQPNLAVGIYDVSGRLLRLYADRDYPVGTHEVTWDGRRGDGSLVPNGIYFVRLTFAGSVEGSAKILVAR